jgi:hypothetical protein
MYYCTQISYTCLLVSDSEFDVISITWNPQVNVVSHSIWKVIDWPSLMEVSKGNFTLELFVKCWDSLTPVGLAKNVSFESVTIESPTFSRSLL